MTRIQTNSPTASPTARKRGQIRKAITKEYNTNAGRDKYAPNIAATMNDNNNNNAFADCKTVIRVRSGTSVVITVTCLWMVGWTLYSNHAVHHSLENSAGLRTSSSSLSSASAMGNFERVLASFKTTTASSASVSTERTLNNNNEKSPHNGNEHDELPDTSRYFRKQSWIINNARSPHNSVHEWSMEASDNIPIFYNLFVNNQQEADRVRKIVDEQFTELLPVHHPIYVHSIGVPLNLTETGAAVIVVAHHETAAEHVTLKSLWDFCQQPDHGHKKVVYLHSKGSFTVSKKNEKLRRFLTVGALSKECATMPEETCNVCSSRFSPVPHPHTSGNMWLARCDYIKKLIDPLIFEAAMNSFDYDGGEAFLACDGRGRYSAEHWVHSHPSVKPCDLFTDPKFTWNYDEIPTVEDLRQSLELAPAPRFDLKTYLKPDIRLCVGRGVSQKVRLDEYKRAYNMTPEHDWWGYKFLLKKEGWWPYRYFGWVELPEEARQAIIRLGYNHHMWETHHHPFQLYGKTWEELNPEQLRILGDIFAYDEDAWDYEIAEERHDRDRITISVKEDKPNTSLDRCEKRKPGADPSIPWMTKTRDDIKENKSLRDYVYEAPEKSAHKKRLLIIASVPRDDTHITTLWSELECFTDHVDHIIISAPGWGMPYIEQVIAMANTHIPHLKKNKVSIEAKYFLNNRYDVGLWCDAYNSFQDNDNEDSKARKTVRSFDEFGLLNDSVFALRRFSGIFDNLEHQNVHMTSLAYSYTGKGNIGFGPEEYWVESAYRGFDKEGMDIFNEHSCVAEDHPFFCPGEDDVKACIINNFEHDLAKEYPCHKVQGLYPADSPELLKPKEAWKRTWSKNTRYWRMLVDAMGFPIAKANEPEQTGTFSQLQDSKLAWKNDPMLKACTKSLPWNKLFNGLDFTIAKPFYQRKWVDLPENIQHLAQDTLGFKQDQWDRAKDSLLLAGKPWSSLSLTKQKALMVLGCSKLHYDHQGCRVQNPIGPNVNLSVVTKPVTKPIDEDDADAGKIVDASASADASADDDEDDADAEENVDASADTSAPADASSDASADDDR